MSRKSFFNLSIIGILAWLTLFSFGCAATTQGRNPGMANIPTGDIKILYQRGLYFQSINKHYLALEEFKMILSIDSQHAVSYNAMGVSYDVLEDWNNARISYKKALVLDQNLDFVWNNWGYSYLLQKDYENAVENFKVAVTLSEKDRYYNNLGLAYAKKLDYKAALACFQKAGDDAAAKLAMIVKENQAEMAAKTDVKSEDTYISVQRNTPIHDSIGVADFDIQIVGPKAKESKPGVLLASTETDKAAVRMPTISVSNTSAKDYNVELIYVHNDIKPLVREVEMRLKAAGYKVSFVQVVSAKYAKTHVSYIGDGFKDASDIAFKIPGFQDIKEIKRFGRAGVKIQVVFGMDMIPESAYIARRLEGTKVN